MNEDRKAGKKITISAANAWIICESRSRPGQKYYYNQTLGVPVWNLTDAEITAALAAKNAGEKCVEPLGPPPGLATVPHPHTSPSHRISPPPRLCPEFKPNTLANQTEATISHNHNQISSRLSNLLLNTIPACNPYSVWDKPPLQCEQFQTAYAEINMNPGASLQHNFQQFIPNNLPNTGVTFSFNVHQPKKRNNKQRRYNNQWRKKMSQDHQPQQAQFNHNNSDLRLKLRRKRSLSESFAVNYVQDNIPESDSHDQDMEMDVTTRLDLAPLKTLTSSGSDSDKWHIVVDTDVILNNYTYLDTMISQDPDCHLVVPHHVWLELHAHATQDDVLARRILRFLTPQIHSGLVILGEEIENVLPRLKTITTCVTIALQNHNVVLISNNKEMLNYKRNNHGIHVFTMQDVKDILTNQPTKIHRHQRSETSPTRAIKIVVPNTYKNEPTTCEMHIPPIQPAVTHVPASYENIETINPIEIHPPENSIPPESASDGIESTSQDTAQEPVQKRRIRLKRSITSDNTQASILDKPDDSTDKKVFKWRLKRDRRNSSVRSKTNSDTESRKKLLDKQINTESSPVKLQRTISNLTKSDTFSETTSKMSEVKNMNKKQIENFVIAETSSEAISNTISSIKSPSPITQVPVETIRIREAVMFRVACQSTEEVLKTRSDEWVSRFVQIMEEVLREKLQEDPPFENKEYPPPWNLQEAARCVIKKFSDHFNVVDAANRLSFMLFKISDKNGKINQNIQPFQYMELYSYGMYLVETLQDVCCNCEDLQTASGSLKNLLFDIHNVNSEATFNDTLAVSDFHENLDDKNSDDQQRIELKNRRDFDDESYYPLESESLFPEIEDMNFNDTVETGLPESATNFLATSESYCQTKENKFHNEIEKQNDQKDKSYNLRSQNKKQTESNKPLPKDPSINTKETTFFKGLNLKKTFHTNTTERNKDDLQDTSNNTENSSPIKVRATSQAQTLRETEANLDSKQNVENGSKPKESKVAISRIFIKFPEFEKKLHMKKFGDEDGDYYDNEDEENYESKAPDESQVISNNGTQTDGDNNGKVQRILTVLGRILKCSFAQVHSLCKNFKDECNIVKKTQLLEKIKKASVFVQKMYNLLDKMIKQEHISQDSSIQKLLQMEYEDFYLHTNKTPEFREVITKLKRETELHLRVMRLCMRYSLQHMAQG